MTHYITYKYPDGQQFTTWATDLDGVAFVLDTIKQYPGCKLVELRTEEV